MTAPDAHGRELVLIGTGRHARVVAETALFQGWKVLGAFGPSPSAFVRWLGSDKTYTSSPESWRSEHPRAEFFLAVVDGPRSTLRKRLLERWDPLVAQWGTVVHPSAIVSPTATVSHGCFIGPKAVINANAALHPHVTINTGAIIEHDCVVGEGTHVAPGALAAGSVRIGRWSWLGAGALCRDDISIGERTVVGMGAVVLNDVESGATVVGVPARSMHGTL